MRTLAGVIVSVALLCVVPAASADEVKEKAAAAAAEAWLALVDAGSYGESWDEAASVFREKVPKAKWESAAAQVRGPLGTLQSRKLKAAEYTTEVPGMPDGEYVILQFDAAYANKPSALETITPMVDKDGKWRVAGYFIR